jgi:hypothetical protein
VPGPTSTTQGPCVVGRAPTLGNERPGCAPNARWTVRPHRDSWRAFGLVSTSLWSHACLECRGWVNNCVFDSKLTRDHIPFHRTWIACKNTKLHSTKHVVLSPINS